MGGDYALVFGAGVVSFASPCVLPLVPVYLSVATGLQVTELAARRSTTTVLRGTGLFAAGFSVVFVLLGLSATALGGALARHQVPITRLAGVVVLVLAAAMLLGTTRRGLLLGGELRFHPRPGEGSAWAAPVTGAAFAFGWTPCIGPVLGSVLAIAAGQDAVLRGGTLLAAYSVGLTLPLLATALLFSRAVGPLRWTRRHSIALTRVAAVVMAGYGLLLVSDRLSWLTRVLQAGLTSSG
jgi:cytochrome c-type biogenesis protein